MWRRWPRIGVTLLWALLAESAAQDDAATPRDAAGSERAVAGRGVRVRLRVVYHDGGNAPERVVVRLGDPFGCWPQPEDVNPRAPFPRDPELKGSDGVIEACVPVEGEFQVLSVLADEHEYRFPNLRLDLRDGAELSIALDRARPITLRLVDARSRVPLPGARLYVQTSGKYGAPFGPHAIFPNARNLKGKPLVADEDGRIRVEAGAGILRSYVVAEGHAWRPVQVLPTLGGEAEVPLLQGGEVRLHIGGWHALETPVLRASCEDPRFTTAVPQPSARGDLSIAGVPAGLIRFDVVHYTRPDVCYGSGVVEVMPGKENVLTITAMPRASGPTEAVEGTLTVPAAWRWPGGTVTASLRGSGAALASAYAEFTCDVAVPNKPVPFRTDRLPAGSYELDVGAFGWHASVDIRPGRRLDLVVPEPRLAVLLFTDQQTGMAVPVGPDWLTCRVPDARTLPLLTISHDEAGRQVVRTASDRIEVRAVAPDYAWLVETINLSRDGVNRIPLRMVRGGDLRIRLRLDGLPFGGDGIQIEMSLGVVDGEPTPWRNRWSPRVVSECFCQGIVRCEDLEPGLWKLSLDEIAGIEPVRCEVEIRSGETTELNLNLKRSR